MSQPTNEQRKIARIMARFATKRDGELTIPACREIVEFLADEEFFGQSAEWKNAMLFELTGADAVCRYRDAAITE